MRSFQRIAARAIAAATLALPALTLTGSPAVAEPAGSPAVAILPRRRSRSL
ncbi:hypothetical protein [Nonomuraea sp. bgisy101]|uniref:hypothetical protein n=1 Tax=Nonomuraea sp. bgisy101 TaxID=3413784 RepID=UPI003D70914B